MLSILTCSQFVIFQSKSRPEKLWNDFSSITAHFSHMNVHVIYVQVRQLVCPHHISLTYIHCTLHHSSRKVFTNWDVKLVLQICAYCSCSHRFKFQDNDWVHRVKWNGSHDNSFWQFVLSLVIKWFVLDWAYDMIIFTWYCELISFVYLINTNITKKLSYCWETVRRESMPRIAEMDVEMTT